ncbi:ATP12 family chaperone protein [Rhodobacter calidifons]|uniref:ATPase n=1 Tax=Rhodobacter calidifons TaxID=2715277 RepID=A0ABX0G316_9RHOB|nr:ATPase [Rhodobacter calidifons]
MNDWTPRRFWSTAQAVPAEGGFTVHLDSRPLRTPRKAPLVLPTAALADAVAAEWQAQGERIDPVTMPFTRMANSAIDTVTAEHATIARIVSDYGGSDLLCYRAEGPAPLVARQAEAWDPLLDWAAQHLHAPLRTTAGVVHVAQSPDSLRILHGLVSDLSPFRLAAFHDLVSLSGSLILALALTRGRIAADTAWRLSRIDEDWQISLWGEDEEAAEVAQRKRAAFLDADRFYALCG